MTFKTMRVEIDQTDPSHLAAVEDCLQKLGYTPAWMNENTARVVAYADGTYGGYALALKGTGDTSLEQLKTMQTAHEPSTSTRVARWADRLNFGWKVWQKAGGF